MTLDKLMKKLSGGEESAFEEIYAQTRKTVYYIALSIVKERALAEDVMQNVYLSVLRNAAQYRAGTNAAAWIAKISRNEALKIQKSRARVSYVDERENIAVFGTQQTDDYSLLIDLAKRILPEDEFVILMLITAAGYKRREISQMLDIPVPTVSWKFNRAIEKMRKSLEESV
ncbi:MAG: RNA polymerase sigma factor [Ruminococcus flavefaciens]|nr:RNA polymerase sigma factor [Ruminococcus flavefaciens]